MSGEWSDDFQDGARRPERLSPDPLSHHMMRYGTGTSAAQIVCDCGWHCARPAGPFLLSGEAMWHLRDVVLADSSTQPTGEKGDPNG